MADIIAFGWSIMPKPKKNWINFGQSKTPKYGRMIVDYNYKPFVYNVESAPAATLVYTPPFKNNKGFIFFNGVDDNSTVYYPTITLTTPNGAGITFSPNLETGSFGDMFMQFKRESSVSTSRSFDIAMVRAGNPFNLSTLNSSFFPFTYEKITINAQTTPGANWFSAPIIITLY